MDPELAAGLPYVPDPDFADVDGARAVFDELLARIPPPKLDGVRFEERHIPGAAGGPDVPVRIFAPEGATDARPGIVDIHGGGFVVSSAALDDGLNARIVRELGVVVVSVDYRRAPEHPFPAAAEDCHAALRWLASSAAELGVDPDRLAVLGDSAGAGIAATTALFARDRGGPALAMQVLIEPVLDDRLQTHSMVTGTDTEVWHRANAVVSWQHYLGGAQATPYAAPARMEDLGGLPRTYLTVNELDPLRDEGLEYAQRLLTAGVSTELHCWPGAYHGFIMVPTAVVTKRALAALVDAIGRGLGVSVDGRPSSGPRKD